VGLSQEQGKGPSSAENWGRLNKPQRSKSGAQGTKLGFCERCSCRVYWTSLILEEDFSTVISPNEHGRNVSISGRFLSMSVDPSTTKA